MNADMPPPLSGPELAAAVDDLEGWGLLDGKLHKEFVFDGFAEAFGFMASAALLAERANHHPEWSNIYNKVWVELVTHDAGGITRFDIELAMAFDRLVAS